MSDTRERFGRGDHLFCDVAKRSEIPEFIHRPLTKTVGKKLREIFPTDSGECIYPEVDHDSITVRARSCVELYRVGLRAHYVLKKYDLHKDVSFGLL